MSEVPPDFMDICDRLERGTVSEREWLDAFHRVCGARHSKDELAEIWNLIIGPEMEGMADFVRDAAGRGFRFVFLSDISGFHIDYIYRTLSFAHLVTGGILSFEVGAKKPESGMYEAFEKAHGKPALYLDDKPENIEGALKRGWRAEVFSSAERAAEILRSCGEQKTEGSEK
jgi:FMN phosphatase YigB (HAD superfamily)